MKKFLFTALLLPISFYAAAQSNLSASAKNVLQIIEKSQQDATSKKGKSELTAKVQQELGIITKNNVQYIATLIKVDDVTIDTKALNTLGVITNTKARDIWTVQVPIEIFSKLSTIKGIKAIDTGGKMKLLMDEVRKDTKTDKVHQGINLAQAYFGNNVVVGIIDIGFDYTHPNFYDPVTKKSRISRIWNQMVDDKLLASIGIFLPPSSTPTGYNYGMELVNLDQIITNIDTSKYKDKAMQFYLSDGSGYYHGTHVAGIATGSGWGKNGKYQGIAPHAEIVLVLDRTTSSSSVVDAIQYIYNYAASVHKPAVINFSAGTHIGPHDGTSLLCQGINNLTGEGKIMVGAAGNDGSSKKHLFYSFKTNDTVFTSLKNRIKIALSGDIVECWASPNTNFSAKVMIYKNGNKIGETKFVPASLNKTMRDTIYNGPDTAFIKIATEAANPNNNRSNIQIKLNRYKGPSLTYHLAFTGTHTDLHAWCDNSAFLSTDQPKYISGNSSYTIRAKIVL